MQSHVKLKMSFGQIYIFKCSKKVFNTIAALKVNYVASSG